ncbi:protein-export chaperone SecB [Eubacterium sp. MSJ-13]|nr:protein-export chaperone SecB [Eubacterium sp. MSJ-13]
MLKINGGAVLLSYLRPIVSSLTMQAGIKPLHLPLIDFTK